MYKEMTITKVYKSVKNVGGFMTSVSCIHPIFYVGTKCNENVFDGFESLQSVYDFRTENTKG